MSDNLRDVVGELWCEVRALDWQIRQQSWLSSRCRELEARRDFLLDQVVYLEDVLGSGLPLRVVPRDE